MKGIKKFAAAGTAAILAASVVFSAGCSFGGGGSSGGGSSSSGYSLSSSAKKIVNGLNESPDYVGFNMNLSMNGTTKRYESSTLDSQWELVQNDLERSRMNMEGKFNIKDCSGDMVMYTSDTGGSEKYESREYVFLRNSHAFLYSLEGNGTVSNFSGLSLAYLGEVSLDKMLGGSDGYESVNSMMIKSMLEMWGIDSSNLLAMYGNSLYEANSMLVTLADAATAVSVKSGVATLDYNKFVYQLVQDAKSILNSIDDNTTISDLLKNKTVKKWIQALTSGFDNATITKAVEEILQPLLKQQFNYTLPSPDRKDDLYSYALKLIDDASFAKRVLGVPTALGSLTVTGLLDMAGGESGMSIDMIKELLNEYTQEITADSFRITVPMGGNQDSVAPNQPEEVTPGYDKAVTSQENTSAMTVSVSGAQVVYTLSGSKVTKQEISCEDISINFTGYDVVTGWESTYYYKTQGTGTIGFTLSVDYATQAYSLKNINNCTIVKEGYEDGSSDKVEVLVSDGWQQRYEMVTVALRANDGELYAVEVSNNGESDTIYVSELEYGKEIMLNGYMYYVRVEQRSYNTEIRIESMDTGYSNYVYFHTTEIESKDTVSSIIKR
ncbi:MAG: hypothetical protein K2H43_05090 [Clostridia bacterium]|nr:hypothetical protein [Clostridia bacterium]